MKTIAIKYAQGVLSDWRRLSNSPGALTNYQKHMPARRLTAGVLKVADYCFAIIPLISRGSILLDIRTKLVGAETIVNSQGETFDEVWERRKSRLPLDSTSDPREWPIDPEEMKYAQAFSRMTLQELNEAFLGLMRAGCGSHLRDRYASEKEPLIVFLDHLSSSDLQIDHNFRSPLASIRTIKEGLEYVRAEKRIDYFRVLHRNYRYKAFLRELMTRWSKSL